MFRIQHRVPSYYNIFFMLWLCPALHIPSVRASLRCSCLVHCVCECAVTSIFNIQYTFFAWSEAFHELLGQLPRLL